MAGKIIVIEGLDGSGKATQTDLLFNKLKSSGVNVKKLTFPCYESNSSALIKMYLSGDFGSSPDDVNPYASCAFYAVDRVASYLKDWKDDYNNGTVFLCDRYSTSNPIYHMGKLEKNQYDEFLEWVQDFEHNKLRVPKPDLVVYLDMPTEVSQKLLTNRYNGNDDKKDLHEKNLDYLKKCRESARYCAEKLGWNVVSCAENSEPKTIEKIAEEIYSLIEGSSILC
jgi:dTMP kinase